MKHCEAKHVQQINGNEKRNWDSLCFQDCQLFIWWWPGSLLVSKGISQKELHIEKVKNKKKLDCQHLCVSLQ